MNRIASTDQGDRLSERAVEIGLLEPGELFCLEYGIIAGPAWREHRLQVDITTRAAMDRSWWASEWGWTLFRTEEAAFEVSVRLDRQAQENAVLPSVGHVPGPEFDRLIQSRVEVPIPLVYVEQYAWLHMLEETGVYAGAWWDDADYSHYSHSRGLVFESWMSEWSLEQIHTIEETDDMDVCYHLLPLAPRGPNGELHRYASWGELEE